MNQPWETGISSGNRSRSNEAHHEKKAERVVKRGYVLRFCDARDNGEPAGSEEDAEGEPETSVGGESGCRERIPHGERPGRRIDISTLPFPDDPPVVSVPPEATRKKHTTCPPAIAPVLRIQRPAPRLYSARPHPSRSC